MGYTLFSALQSCFADKFILYALYTIYSPQLFKPVDTII
jgi:hypothetical protein